MGFHVGKYTNLMETMGYAVVPFKDPSSKVIITEETFAESDWEAAVMEGTS